MSLSCSILFRTAFDMPHHGSAKNVPGTELAPRGETLDFTDPTMIICRNGKRVIEQLGARNDLIYGYPNPKTMTNFIRWRHYSICLSDGMVWALDWKSKSWAVVEIQNIDHYDWQENSPLDFLMDASEQKDALRVMVGCENGELHGYSFAYSDNVNDSIGNSENSITSSDSNSSSMEENTVVDVAARLAQLEVSPQKKDNRNCSFCNHCQTKHHSLSNFAMADCGHVACADCLEDSLDACGFCEDRGEDLLAHHH